MAETVLDINRTLFLTDEDVRSVFNWTDAIEALRSAYSERSEPAMFPPRTMARGQGLWLRTLSGVAPDGGLMGAKIIAASHRTAFASYLIALFDQKSTALVALLDGNSITGFRTAATSALAADLLLPETSLRVAVIGSGFEAKKHLRALAALRSIERAVVFSPNSESRQRFVREMADLPFAIDMAEKAEIAAEGANLILCAARSRDESPTLRGEWLSPGVTVISIGSTLPEQRELDVDAIRRADLVVADMVDEVAHDTGDMIAASADGCTFATKLIGLDAVASGQHPGRTDKSQIIIYKSVGAAIQDLTVSTMCAIRAAALGIGVPLPVTIARVNKGKEPPARAKQGI